MIYYEILLSYPAMMLATSTAQLGVIVLSVKVEQRRNQTMAHQNFFVNFSEAFLMGLDSVTQSASFLLSEM